MGKSSSAVVGYRYHLDAHSTLMEGQGGPVWAVWFDQKFAATGPFTDDFTINARELFGGDDREGGVSGVVEFLSGESSQTVSTYLDNAIAGPVPAFRGVSSFVFQDFYWGNNPFFKDWSFALERIDNLVDGSAQWYPETSKINGGLQLNTSIADQPLIFSFGNAPPQPPQPVAFTPYAEQGTPNLRSDSVTSDGITAEPGLDGYWIDANAGIFNEIETRVYLRVGQERLTAPGTARVTLEAANFQTVSFDRASWVITADVNTTAVAIASGQLSSDPVDWTPYDSGVLVLPAGTGDVSIRLIGRDGSAFRDIRFAVGAETNAPDMNPAHIVREAITDTAWGGGTGSLGPDDVSFTAAADTLLAESFGLSMWYDPSSETPLDLINNVCQHIDAAHYVGRDGRDYLKLIRNDYAPSDVVAFDDADILDIRPVWEKAHEVPNKVQVRYWDWSTLDIGSISDSNEAAIRSAGRVNSQTQDYIGITSPTLASRVLERDLKALSTPKIKGRAVLTRRGSSLNPGDVVSFTSTRNNLSGEVMRVLDIEEYIGLDNRIEISWVQDVFALESGVRVEPDDRYNINREPQPATVRIIQEAPYYELVQEVGDSTAQDILAENPAAGFIHASAAAPNGLHTGARVWVDAGNSSNFTREDRLEFSPSASISADLSALPTDEIAGVSGLVGLSSIETGTLAQIGAEIVRVDAVSASSVTLKRGVLDTIPQLHSSGSAIIFWADGASRVQTEYNSGLTPDVKLRTQTGSGVLSLLDAPTDQVVMNRRALRPYPPGALQLEGSYEPVSIADGDQLTWTDRNRLEQTDGTLSGYIEDDYTIEPGTTYRLDLFGLDASDAEIGAAYYSATATSPLALTEATYLSGIPSGSVKIRIRLTSVRDGLDSWQSPFLDVPITFALLKEDGDAILLESGDKILQE